MGIEEVRSRMRNNNEKGVVHLIDRINIPHENKLKIVEYLEKRIENLQKSVNNATIIGKELHQEFQKGQLKAFEELEKALGVEKTERKIVWLKKKEQK